jgi:citrate lyase subunit beta / citryl-CoA lyase
VLDLEDSVPASDKAAARQAIAEALAQWSDRTVPVVLRPNAPASEFSEDDLRWIARLPPTDGLMIPKAESAQALAPYTAERDTALLPLIETAAGLKALSAVATAPGVLRLVVGHIDFMADTGIDCSDDERELDPLRFAVAIETRIARLAPAIDGVTTAIQDDDRLCADTLRAMKFGFGGKLCIHPRQVAIVHDRMAPRKDDLDWARRVIDADLRSGGAAVQLDGRMVDVPVVLRARRLLALAGAR